MKITSACINNDALIVPAAVVAAMEPILQSVLRMRPMRDPELLTMQARSLEALAGYLAARPASVPPVLQKVLAPACNCMHHGHGAPAAVGHPHLLRIVLEQLFHCRSVAHAAARATDAGHPSRQPRQVGSSREAQRVVEARPACPPEGRR